jgi:cyanophycin synthetase
MERVEVRDLDGPNLFMLRPAIKLEVAAPDGRIRICASSPFAPGPAGSGGLVEADADALFARLEETIVGIHERCEQPRPQVAHRAMEAPNHYAVAFSWAHRRFAMAAADLAFRVVTGELAEVESTLQRLREVLAGPAESDDAPEMIANASRRVPIIGVTGTNGKTTTSRLIASVMRHAGKRVGLTSSSGVYIEGELVLPGDYTGPAGAQRVFAEPEIDIAVLETARGGILLRGIGYEQNDVSVVTNISADHLGLHGIYTVEGLAEVKSLVARVTKPDGFAVLNADDPLVLAMRERIVARPFLVTRKPLSDAVQRHIDAGGWALILDGSDVIWWHDRADEVLTRLEDVPITFGGKAPHMVENALCAAAACLGAGLPATQVRDGLSAFRSSPSDNKGRLNVYTRNGATIIIDFAHNEAGLRQLLAFARHFRTEGGSLTAVVGTAGDREDSVFRAIGRIAASEADRVVLKDSVKYLRGRVSGEMLTLMQSGVDEAGRAVAVATAPNEEDAALGAIERAGTGDVVAVMCIEAYDHLLVWLDEHAKAVS